MLFFFTVRISLLLFRCYFFAATFSLLLFHCYFFAATISLLLFCYYFLTATFSLLLFDCYYFTATFSLLPFRCGSGEELSQGQGVPGEGRQLRSHSYETSRQPSHQLDRFMDRWIVMEQEKAQRLQELHTLVLVEQFILTREPEIRDAIPPPPPPTLHFINGAFSHTRSSLVKYDSPPPPPLPPLPKCPLFLNLQMW